MNPKSDRIVLFVGGMGESIETYLDEAEIVEKAGHSVGIIIQQSERADYIGPGESLVEDFHQVMKRLVDQNPNISFDIFAHSMGAITVERFLQVHPDFGKFIKEVRYTNPMFSKGSFFPDKDFEEVKNGDPNREIQLKFHMGAKGKRTRAFPSVRRVGFLTSTVLLGNAVLQADLQSRADVTTSFMIAPDDPNLDLETMAQYIGKLRANQFRVHEIALKLQPLDKHNPWRSDDAHAWLKNEYAEPFHCDIKSLAEIGK